MLVVGPTCDSGGGCVGVIMLGLVLPVIVV